MGLALAAALTFGSALPALAIHPVGQIVIQVTDCRTGQPVPAGYAFFSIPRALATAVAPIDDGTVGPIGLGANQYALTLTAPTYRPLHRMLQGTGDFSTTQTVALCLHPVAGSPEVLVTTTYPISVSCSPAVGEVCSPAFSVSVSTAAILEVQFTASSANCSSISVDVQEDGFGVFISDPLGPGDSTQVADVGPAIPGTHTLSVQATGIAGGCNTGDLVSWAGTLAVTVELPVGPTFRDQCLHGGWANFDAFQNQGECIAYVVSAGRHS